MRQDVTKMVKDPTVCLLPLGPPPIFPSGRSKNGPAFPETPISSLPTYTLDLAFPST